MKTSEPALNHCYSDKNLNRILFHLSGVQNNLETLQEDFRSNDANSEIIDQILCSLERITCLLEQNPKEPNVDNGVGEVWIQMWEAAREDGLEEWNRLCFQKENDIFLLAERLRLMNSEEIRILGAMLGWSTRRVGAAARSIQSIVVDHLYPAGRPH